MNMVQSKRLKHFSSFIIALCVFTICLIPVGKTYCYQDYILDNGTYVFSMPMQRPAVGDRQGYIELFLENKTNGRRSTRVIWWNVTRANMSDAEFNMFDTRTTVRVSSSGSVELDFIAPDNVSAFVTTGYMWEDGQMGYGGSPFTGIYNFSWSSSNHSILGYRVYGNFGNVTDNINDANVGDFLLNYGSANLAFENFQYLYSLLDSIGIDISFILDNFTDKNGKLYFDIFTENLEDINKLLIEYLDSVEKKQDSHSELLLKIIEILEDEGIEKTDKLDDDSINESLNAEDELLKDSDSVADNIDDLDITTYSQGFGFIWDMVTRLINLHPAISTMFISVLSIGIIVLILNR